MVNGKAVGSRKVGREGRQRESWRLAVKLDGVVETGTWTCPSAGCWPGCSGSRTGHHVVEGGQER